MPVDQATIDSALRGVPYPGFSRDIVSFGLVRSVEIEGRTARVRLSVSTEKEDVPRQLETSVRAALEQIDGIDTAEVHVAVSAPKGPASGAAQGGGATAGGKPQGVKKVIAVASGKGGVGKSTFSVNLACALEKLYGEAGRPESVGLFDADIYGPSVPLMLGASEQPTIEDNMIQPPANFGVKVMSMGLLIDETTPVVWRGPMIMKTIQQFAQNVNWGELDVLVVDLPPGTGDAQLSLVQTLPVDGALIVTTPQMAAVQVARRGATMFGKVNVPLVGVAENMSYLELPGGEKQYLFGQGGGERTARDLETDFLGAVPLDPHIREGSDQGIPIVVGSPQSASAQAFRTIAGKVFKFLKSES